MFGTLRSLLVGNDAALAELGNVEAAYNKVAGEITVIEGKLTDAITKRDKYKGFAKSVKDQLGIEEGEELSSETLSSKISVLTSSKDATIQEKERLFKLEMTKLEDVIKQKDEAIVNVSNDANTKALNTAIELELYKTTAGISAVNERAHAMIIQELKSGATIEDGVIVFKNADGTTNRTNGIPTTLAGKLEAIKTSEDMSFLFKASVNSGSGTQTTSGKTTMPGVSDFASKKIAEAKLKGINISL
jgi:hypothetical protein